MFEIHSPVAQSVEQVAVNHPVGGSNPSRGANKRCRDASLFSFKQRGALTPLFYFPNNIAAESSSINRFQSGCVFKSVAGTFGDTLCVIVS